MGQTMEADEEYALPVTDRGVMRIVPRLRERYLSPEVEDAVVQAAGTHLRVWLWSERQHVALLVPFDGLRWERPYERSVTRWGVNVNRWLTPGNQNDRAGWWSDATLDTGALSDGRRGVRVRVQTHTEPDPRRQP